MGVGSCIILPIINFNQTLKPPARNFSSSVTVLIFIRKEILGKRRRNKYINTSLSA